VLSQLRRHRTNRWTGATGSEFRIKRHSAKLLGSAVARSTPPVRPLNGMGLDSVELVIRFEDAFGISISDDVAAKLTTPREVTDYVMTQVAAGHDTTCLSQQAFYFLRTGFSKRLQLPRNAFRADVSLPTLISERDRKRVWGGLKAELGETALPNLARPLWLFSLLAAITLLVGSYAFYATPKLPLQLNVWAALAASGVSGFFCLLCLGR
jgi:acyl carrier protein